MCGINGIVNFSKKDSCKEIQLMNQIIRDRGPDYSDYWKNEFCTFGHVRLSIIDPEERSNQPFEKNNFIIIFNGEIYNFKELKKKLSKVDFITESDTEVVLELWRKYGFKALNMLRGMFAFAIYDKNNKKVFLARDHFGIKPLFYQYDNKRLIFSSELKAIRNKLNIRKSELNKKAIVASTLYVYIPENLCIYKDIHKLPPGKFIEVWGNGNFKIKSYWNNKKLIQNKPLSTKKDVVNQLNQILLKSVEKHLIADVPVGTFLSGGLDSSLITAMACSFSKNINSYSLSFRNKDNNYENMPDDFYYASKCAKFLGIKLNKIEAEPNMISMLKYITHKLDEPIGDSSAISTYLICKKSNYQGCKVLLSGMGADEIFGGYKKHLANIYSSYYGILPKTLKSKVNSLFFKLPVSSSSKGYTFIRWIQRFLSFAGMSEQDSFLRSYTYYSFKDLNNIFYDDVESDYISIKKDHHKIFNYARKKRDIIDSMCFTDLCNFMPSLNLTYTDRASMAASTEVRVPFIDKEVIKFAFSLKSNQKIKFLSQKNILKKVAENWLPKEIIYRPKSSFTLPLRSWIRNDFLELVKEYLLSEKGLFGRKLFKPEFLKNLINDEISGRKDNAQKIWHLLVLEQWFKNQNFN